VAIGFSPDGKTFLTGSADKTAQLWDVATGRPIGPRWEHSSQVYCVACSPDGKTFLTAAWDDVTRLWDAPRPLPDDLERLSAWVEAATGLGLDEQGAVRALDNEVWHRRRDRLAQLGGSPPDPSPLLDPILFGPDPTARGDALAERGRWDRAEAAYAEAARARPFNRLVREALARFHVERGHLDRAAATLDEAVRLMPDDAELRRQLGLVLLVSGDRMGWRRVIAELRDRFPATSDPATANLVARACVWGPDAVADPGVPVRLAEAAVRGAAERDKAACLNTLGATFYRAGRHVEALRRLDEAVQLQGEAGGPADWAFLAMAHHRLGHQAEARRWLDRLRGYLPVADPTLFWHEQVNRLLWSEAEAVVLYDPAFPDDPFAH
jgi:tetratricopeptide (TPR) repeat protein